MKKLLVLFMIFAVLGLVACSDDDNTTTTGYTAQVTVTLPVGTSRAFNYKLARNLGWDNGEEADNQGANLADAATQTITRPFVLYVSNKSVDTNTITYPTVTAPAAGNLKIALWLNGATDPGANAVVLMGAWGNWTNAGLGTPLNNWSASTNNVMTKVSEGLYAIEIAAPTSPFTGAVDFKFLNVDGDGSSDGGWFGETKFGNGTLTIANDVIVGFANNASTGYTASCSIQNGGSTVVIDIGSQGGWYIHADGALTQESVVTFVWTGVPPTHDNNSHVWTDTADGTAVIAGALTNFLGDNYDGTQLDSWDPPNCLPVTVTK